MKVAVIGSRTFNDQALLYSALEKIDSPELIVSGGAKGADQLAEQYAREKNIPIKVFLPDYAKYGRAAPTIRNKSIVQEADIVIAFWDGHSRGTQHSLKIAKEQNKEIRIVKFEEQKITNTKDEREEHVPVYQSHKL